MKEKTKTQTQFERDCQLIRACLIGSKQAEEAFTRVERRAFRVSGKEDVPLLHLNAGRKVAHVFCGRTKHSVKSVKLTGETDFEDARWCTVCVMRVKRMMASL